MSVSPNVGVRFVRNNNRLFIMNNVCKYDICVKKVLVQKFTIKSTDKGEYLFTLEGDFLLYLKIIFIILMHFSVLFILRQLQNVYNILCAFCKNAI